MRILIDARPIQTYSRFRGIGRYVNQIIELFKDEPDFYFLFFKGKNIDESPKNRIVMGTPRRGITFTDNIFLSRIIKKYRIDVFHSTSFALPFKLHDVKFIITIFDLTPLLFPQFSTGKNIFIFNKILRSAKNADKIIAISKNTKNDLINFKSFPGEKIKVIYPPVIIKKEKSISNNEKIPGLPSEYVFYAGGFDGNKNVITLIKALNIFHKPLVITGLIETDQRMELKNILKNEISDLIHFTGFVSDRDLKILYRNAKLFVFPSLYEGFGYPPLEALGNGTPSVVSGAGSIREVMKDAAIYLENPLDENELAEKIDLLWDNAGIREKIVNKSDGILEEYSLGNFKKELEKIYFGLSIDSG